MFRLSSNYTHSICQYIVRIPDWIFVYTWAIVRDSPVPRFRVEVLKNGRGLGIATVESNAYCSVKTGFGPPELRSSSVATSLLADEDARRFNRLAGHFAHGVAVRFRGASRLALPARCIRDFRSAQISLVVRARFRTTAGDHVDLAGVEFLFDLSGGRDHVLHLAASDVAGQELDAAVG